MKTGEGVERHQRGDRGRGGRGDKPLQLPTNRAGVETENV